MRDALAGNDRAVLIDFPHHSNVGDSAIWLGERRALRELGVTVPYACSLGTWNVRAARAAVGDGVVLLHGGGNFGDVWPAHQQFREHVIATMRDKRVIVLPQTIHFSSDEAMRRAANALGTHPDITVLVRDRPSRGAAERLGVNTVLCPDPAFALGALRRRAPVQPQIWLLRTDAEAIDHPASVPEGVVPVDWLRPGSTSALRRGPITVGRVAFSAGRRLDRVLVAGPLRGDLSWRSFDRIAREHLHRGARLVSDGNVVVTDRLHGHILCLLLGIPHVVLDNHYGKLRRFIEAWTHESPLVRTAESTEQAAEIAAELGG
ncbi:MAG: polysaccharide pyruvyl transferase family protein [Actinomycetota bacterium]